MNIIERKETIIRILAAARKPVPEIVPVKQLLASNGQWYGANGFPLGVNMVEPAQVRIIGYAYRGRDGCTYGTRGASPEELTARWETHQDNDAADFRASMDDGTDERLAEQAAYWLKSAPVVKCDMTKDCANPVTHLDDKGYVYCTVHGSDRRFSGRSVRKLKPAELRKIKAGQTI